MSRSVPGTVMAVQANFYQVRLDDLPGQMWLCTRRSRLKKIGQKVMVGDRVVVVEPDWQDQRGAIAEVLPRATELDRPAVANAQQILLVFSLAEPSLEPWQLSRFLVKAESNGLDVCLCLNKCDLVEVQEQESWRERLGNWGYQPLFVSVAQGKGFVELMPYLAGKITVVAGPSGVGKSSLINGLIPESNLRVAEVSGKLGRGRHTTRHVQLFELPGRGFLADTPGFNQPDLACNPADLAGFFPEVRSNLYGCQFGDCLHKDEPNCQVRGIWERYEHYLQFLADAIASEQSLQDTPDPDASLKRKIKGSGQEQYEPRLAMKKYRRSSRRQKNQALQDWYEKQGLEDF